MSRPVPRPITALHLSEEEWTKTRAVAEGFKDDRGWFGDWNALHIVLFLERTGAHPEVLARAKQHHLEVVAEKGYLWVRWSRPKKKGMAATCNLPAWKDIPENRWVFSFVQYAIENPRSLFFHYQLLRAVGDKAGIHLTARRLRHLCGVHVARDTRDINVVTQWLNCTLRTALAYIRIGGNDPRMLAVAEARETQSK